MDEVKKEEMPENISYVAYESAMARAEKRYHNLLIALIIVISLWFVTVIAGGGAFFWYLTLPVEETFDNVTQTTDKGGSNQVIGGDYNDKTDSNAKDDSQSESGEKTQFKHSKED